MSEKNKAQTSSRTNYLLGRIADEAQRAQSLDDPLEQAKIVATLIQPYAGWALRAAVMDCQQDGQTWAQIAPNVGLSQQVLSRQARGKGPLVTIAPAYGDSSRNADAHSPLRLAATSVVGRTLELADTHPKAPSAKILYIAVLAMAQAQAANQAEPLRRTAHEVLRLADRIDRDRPEASAQERTVWGALEELRFACEHDHGTADSAAPSNSMPRTGSER